MRAKHHYKIIKIVYEYEGDYCSFDYKTHHYTLYETNKRAKAERFYYNHLWQENGTEYKGIYYPNCKLIFQRDY